MITLQDRVDMQRGVIRHNSLDIVSTDRLRVPTVRDDTHATPETQEVPYGKFKPPGKTSSKRTTNRPNL